VVKLNIKKTLASLFILTSTQLYAATFAYVPNEGSGTISVIDTQTDTVVDEINIGGKPRGIAISPDGNTLYVSEQKGEHVDVIDTKTKKYVPFEYTLNQNFLESYNQNIQQISSFIGSLQDLAVQYGVETLFAPALNRNSFFIIKENELFVEETHRNPDSFEMESVVRVQPKDRLILDGRMITTAWGLGQTSNEDGCLAYCEKTNGGIT